MDRHHGPTHGAGLFCSAPPGSPPSARWCRSSWTRTAPTSAVPPEN